MLLVLLFSFCDLGMAGKTNIHFPKNGGLVIDREDGWVTVDYVHDYAYLIWQC